MQKQKTYKKSCNNNNNNNATLIKDNNIKCMIKRLHCHKKLATLLWPCVYLLGSYEWLLYARNDTFENKIKFI